ncbi:MAG: transcription antitermination factor NusB [Endomicrobium sp.]|jgi:transcription antitermination factor NusB|nr:transcription antitermination factor NusB [Endomicrobium sp.]
MSSRREARECSLQMLYIADTCNIPIETVLDSFSQSLPTVRVYRDFAEKLFRGVCQRREEIDCLIKQYVKNWDLGRMATVDRNIIRLATYEILATPEAPISVIIDEAVEISKKYSTKDSSKFVNGILDKIKIVRSDN